MHRNLGQNPSLFLSRLELAHFAADSSSQVLTTFQHHPTFPSTVFHSFGSLSTHSLFMHHSSNIDQRCCSERNTLILHSSALFTHYSAHAKQH